MSNYRGLCRAEYANRLLAEIAGGHFDWRSSIAEDAVAYNKRVLASWKDLWAQTSGDVEFWLSLDGVDQHSRPRVVEVAPLRFIDNELVMSPGMTIKASTSEGTITITAGQGFWRSYGWG